MFQHFGQRNSRYILRLKASTMIEKDRRRWVDPTGTEPAHPQYSLVKNGGSGGARTRPESLIIKGLGGVPSQIASQKPVALSHDLAQVVVAWDKLSAPLKAAILAIANTATDKGGL
jgi:hypothetical protein